MFVAVDVDYGPADAHAAAVLFADWADSNASATTTALIADVEPYVPGSFYRRELPCLLDILQPLAGRFHTVVVDGHVWLGPGHTRPGLGAYLYDALARAIPVIGVAKNHFAGNQAIEVYRGQSRRPLYVTAVGTAQAAAATAVGAMHGAHRIPTLLKQVDRLARQRS